MFTWNHGTMNYLRTYTQNQLIPLSGLPMLNSSILLLIALVVGHPEV